MGKVESTIYQCDKCKDKFFEPEDVLDIQGKILDGDEGEIIEGSMLCPVCFVDATLIERDILDPIIELSEQLQDEMAAKEEKKEENDEMGKFDDLLSEGNNELEEEEW